VSITYSEVMAQGRPLIGSFATASCGGADPTSEGDS
jgi:hypothetical protein